MELKFVYRKIFKFIIFLAIIVHHLYLLYKLIYTTKKKLETNI